jgi:hypothetical protein
VNSGEIFCYLYWGKAMFYSPSSGATAYNYTQPTRNIYLQKSGRLYTIKSRSSFTDQFDEVYRKDINRFLRTEKIHFNKTTTESLHRLMEYCNNLTGGSDEGI